MEGSFIVNGGIPLKGEIELSGAKNVALKVLIASLLFSDTVTLQNIPKINDVDELIGLLKLLGAKITFEDNNITIDPTCLSSDTVDLLYGSKIRVSFMLFAPLLYRFGRAVIPNPGGCRLGARPIDRHIEMMKAFGIDISYNSKTGYYTAIRGEKAPDKVQFKFDKPTHTGTELAILFAVFSKAESIIENVALEPEIDDLIRFLNVAGARVERKGDKIYTHGGTKLDQKGKPYRIGFDRNEAVTYACFAFATGGDIIVKGAETVDLESFIEKIREAGGGIEARSNGIRFYSVGDLQAVDVITDIHPGFMTDWQGPWAVLMTQAAGISTLHERIFENRFSYVDELRKLGAKIEFFQPEVSNDTDFYHFSSKEGDFKKNLQAIKIYGKTKLHNGVMNVADLRAGATLLIAATVAEGESIIDGASNIDRGYENIEGKLQQLGADIKRV